MKIYYLCELKKDPEYYIYFQKNAIYHLRRSEIVIFPTDTIYGLSAIPFLTAVKKIHILKQRSFFKNFIFLFPNYQSISEISNQIIPKQFYNFTIPITLIIQNPHSPSNGIAIRIPQRKYLKNILEEIYMPIISTSVNIQGKKPLHFERDIIKFAKMYSQIKLVLIDEDSSENLSSTIIDIRNKPYKILREGKGYHPNLLNQIS